MIVALAALVVPCFLTPPVHADFVYSNGSLSNGTNGAWNINGSDAVSDSFTLTSTTTLTSALLGIWVSEGQAPTSVNWSIGTSQFGSNLGSGVNASLTNVFEYNNPYLSSTYSIYDSTFSLDVVLARALIGSRFRAARIMEARSWAGMRTLGLPRRIKILKVELDPSSSSSMAQV
jgi:hypothetical protein